MPRLRARPEDSFLHANPSLFRPIVAAFLFVFLAATTGCSNDPGRGSVKGKITVDGKPLPKGMITFLSEAGNKDPFSSAIVNGEYAIPDMPAAAAKVYIILPLSDEPLQVDKGDLMAPVRPGRVSKLTVNEKYQNSATSGLEFTLQKGENTYDINLNP